MLRELAGPGVPILPVVKADAYGHGAVPVALALERAGADGFCVATLDEAVELRDAGIDAPILVLYPVPPGLGPVARARSIAVSAGDAQLLARLLAGLGEDAGGSGHPPLAIQLEVETGLGRGGFAIDALPTAVRRIEDAPGAVVTGLWTHLQAAEDAARTAAQVRRFETATALLRAADAPPGRHLAATGGLVTGGVASLDGARPGLAVFGLLPDELLAPGGAPAAVVRAEAARLRPVLSLHARPVRVAQLEAGWGVSYGPSFTTARPSRIATLPLGYGDGWPRALSNRAAALVRGRRVPLVGTVAMDAVMADVTDVPGPPVGVDDEFVLVGRQGDLAITVPEVAAARGTMSWEVVTDLAARLPRVYHAASVPRAIRTLAGLHPTGDAGPFEPGDRRSIRP